MTDREIVDLYISKDEYAITATKTQYGKRIRKILYEITGDYDSVKDCENECYYNMWNSIPPHTPYDYFFPFITAIARNVALNHIKAKNRRVNEIPIEEFKKKYEHTVASDKIEDIINTNVLIETINSYILTLSDEKRNVFIRRYWYMDSIKEISQVYNISISNVKSILFRCRNDLRNILKKEGYDI